MSDARDAKLLTLTADIVAAFVSNNFIRSGDLPGLIATTYASLASAAAPSAAAAAQAPGPEFTPAVSIRRSLCKREVILSMIDGKPYRALKRHLTAHGLTPAAYRERYNLPNYYPMVAPAYSEARSEIARRTGLGGKANAASTASSDSGADEAPARAVRKPAARRR